MTTILPSGFLFIPIAIVAALRKEWATYFAIGSIPFFALRPFVAAGHPFTLPELAVLSVLFNQVLEWVRCRTPQLPASGTLLWLWGFLTISILSVIYAALNPPTLTVHPYNTGSLDSMVFRQYQFSLINISQLILRSFIVVAVTLIAFRLTIRQIKITIRYLIVAAVITGLFGILYQLSIHTAEGFLIESVIDIGFSGIRLNFSRFGPLPRMYSFPGEPGYVAHFLLYALGITVTIVALPKSNILHRRIATVAMVLLICLIALTTSTTGYGGLVVLGMVVIVAHMHFDEFNLARIIWVILPFLFGVSLLLVFTFIRVEYQELIRYQIKKLQFETGSGPLRLQYLLMAVNITRSRPALGVGVGSHYGASVIGTILAESGLLGLGAFVGLLFSTFRDSTGLALNENGEIREMAIIFTVAGVTVWLTVLPAKSITALLFPWSWFSLALPIALVLRQGD